MNPFTWIKNQSFFRDGRAVWLWIISLLGLVILLVFSMANIESQEFKVPVRYSGYFEGNLSDRAEWFNLYALPMFAVITFAFNTVLSIKVHRMRPELTKTLLGLNLLVLFFTFLVTRAILGLV